jgi:hypothetical protein
MLTSPPTVQRAGSAHTIQISCNAPDCCLLTMGLLTTPVSETWLLQVLSWLWRTPCLILPPGAMPPPSGTVPSLRVAWSRTVRRTLDVVMALVKGPA